MKEQAQGRSSTDMTLVAVSLNIGGRNTNPLEFLLDGDSSKEGLSATRARVRAQEAMVDAECGPARMASTERAIVDEIISSIISELGGDRKYIDALLSSSCPLGELCDRGLLHTISDLRALCDAAHR